jgi:membrane protein YdbS with pleckstrin-like domain
LRVFRASRRYFHLEATVWACRQSATALGIVFSLVLLSSLQSAASEAASGADRTIEKVAREVFAERWPELRAGALEVWGWLQALEVIAVATFLLGAILSWTLLRLRWEARWYMVSDECLRIREGLLRTHERTMTVANIQNLTIRRGPLQKLFRIADLEVRTAGGGAPASGDEHGEASHDLHVARFRGVDDAEALRDRIQAALLRHRDSGLGDPDERGHEDLAPALSPAVLPAAQELVREARRLRATVETLERPRAVPRAPAP